MPLEREGVVDNAADKKVRLTVVGQLCDRLRGQFTEDVLDMAEEYCQQIREVGGLYRDCAVNIQTHSLVLEIEVAIYAENNFVAATPP